MENNDLFIEVSKRTLTAIFCDGMEFSPKTRVVKLIVAIAHLTIFWDKMGIDEKDIDNINGQNCCPYFVF